MNRPNRHETTQGFTIVELIIVIIIIAILTAITIVGYGAWRNGLAESEVKNDLLAAGAALKNHRNFNNGYPATVPPGGTIAGFTPSGGVNFVFASSSVSDFCIEAVSTVNEDAYYYLRASEGDQPKHGNCALGEDYDPDFPSEIAMQGAVVYSPRAMSSDPATGDLYFASGTNVYKYTFDTQAISTIVSGLQTDALEFGGDGYLYMFSGAGSSVTAQKLDLSSGVRTNVSATTVESGNGLYKSGNQLYVGSKNNIYVIDITTGVRTSLYYNVSNMYSSGLVVVGSTLYFLRANAQIQSIPVAGSASATTLATIPSDSHGVAGIDLVHYNGSLYLYGSVPGKSSIYAYKISTGTLSVAIDNVQANSAIYSCSLPNALEIFNGRAVYVPNTEPSSGLTCDGTPTSSTMHMMPVPAN